MKYFVKFFKTYNSFVNLEFNVWFYIITYIFLIGQFLNEIRIKIF